MQKIETKKKRTVRLFFTGLSMGLADLVPGVSGGTIAFLFGIYDELLASIKLITGEVPRLMLAGEFRQAFKIAPLAFLIPLAFGILSAIFGFAHVVSFLLYTQPVLVWAFFFGLVLGSAYVISKRVTVWNTTHVWMLILGFVVAFGIVGLPALNGSGAPLAIFVTGAIAITAMILPGISGSLIMVLLGQYETIISIVAERDFFLMGIFAMGALTGLALFVRLLTWLMKRYYLSVVSFLIGVMLGSLRQIWPWQELNMNGTTTNVLPPVDFSVLWVLMLAVLGFAVVFMLERVGIARENGGISKHNGIM